MQYYIVEFSKYAISILIGIYTLEACLALGKKRDNKKTGVFTCVIFSKLCIKNSQLQSSSLHAVHQNKNKTNNLQINN